ncbi:MAG: hypothetical protein QOE70_3789 [Chthoniobacter sp.]|jgi:hypothetical protein|nr:hypothetical protein [Chthoniobacter sp.]
MKKGDLVGIVKSDHSSVPIGSIGAIDSALDDGYGVILTGEFFVPGVVPATREETRTVWFHRHSLELVRAEDRPRTEPVACAIEPRLFGAQVCVSCDALERVGG